MARKPNSVATVTITISTTEKIEAYLEKLVTGGLYGKNKAEAAERLVAKAVENLFQNGNTRSRRRK